MNRVIYISGPMTGLPDFNREAFFKAERELAKLVSADFVNPARINGTETEGWKWADYMRVALREMMAADCIYMLEGWEKSKGALLELEVAKQLGMSVMFQQPTLIDWQAKLKEGFLVLDTETTGLGTDAEIVEISLIDHTGQVHLDTLVKPKRPIPQDVVRIHGITNDRVACAMSWESVGPMLLQAIKDSGYRNLVIWNAAFDTRMLRQADESVGAGNWTRDPQFALNRLGGNHGIKLICAQEDYRRRFGERKPDGTLKRQSLASACKQLGIEQDANKAHRSLYDCQMTLKVIEAVAARQEVAA